MLLCSEDAKIPTKALPVHYDSWYHAELVLQQRKTEDNMRKDIVCLSVIAFIAVLIALSVIVAGCFWIPSWYGWLSLVIGIVLTCLTVLFIHSVYVLISGRTSPIHGICSLFFWGFVFSVLLVIYEREHGRTNFSSGKQ